MDTHRYLIQGEHPYPHMGRLLSGVLHAKHVPKTTLSRLMGVSHSVAAAYCNQPSLQGGVLWKAGLAIKHNFFADLTAHFPYDQVPEAAQKRIDELERELAIYKSIVLKTG